MPVPTPAALLPTQAEVCASLDYNPDTGVFTRKVSRFQGKGKAGSVAGYVNPSGYRRIMVNNRGMWAHRLAWVISTGSWPEGEVDHINGERDDNRLANLRACTHAENRQNMRRPQRNSTSGVLGVSFDKSRGKWCAKIKVKAEGRNRTIGRYATLELASAAYLAAKAKMHPYQTLVPV